MSWVGRLLSQDFRCTPVADLKLRGRTRSAVISFLVVCGSHLEVSRGESGLLFR